MPDWNILITLLVATVIVIVVAYFIHLRRTPQREALELWAIQLVRAAEQMFPQDNATKLDYCLDMLTRIYPALDEDLLRSVIEYAVYRLKKETAQDDA